MCSISLVSPSTSPRTAILFHSVGRVCVCVRESFLCRCAAIRSEPPAIIHVCNQDLYKGLVLPPAHGAHLRVSGCFIRALFVCSALLFAAMVSPVTLPRSCCLPYLNKRFHLCQTGTAVFGQSGWPTALPITHLLFSNEIPPDSLTTIHTRAHLALATPHEGSATQK